MHLSLQIDHTISYLIGQIRKRQYSDGSWRFCFETGPMTDSYMILLMNILGRGKEAWLKPLAKRLLSLQGENGAWKLYADEEGGNLSATIEACFALIYGEYASPNDPKMKLARIWIQENMDKKQIHSVTKVLLSVLGHQSWREFPKLPIQLFLVPKYFPISFYHFVGYARVHIGPIMMIRNQKYQVTLPKKQVIDSWVPDGLLQRKIRPDLDVRNKRWFKSQLPLAVLQKGSKKLAMRVAKKFILNRIEQDGTLYSYFSSTFWMILALLSDYPKNHPVIERAIRGLQNMITVTEQEFHLQETTSTVWDTSLLLYSLQEAGVPSQDPMIQRGLSYLKKRQHSNKADWSWNNPNTPPGGWGFSDVNTINPDNDDTSAVLRAMAPTVAMGHNQKEWQRGVTWLVSMQNNDGGWSAFEKNTNARWFRYLPYRDGITVWGDPSTADITGRVLHFLGSVMGLKHDHPTCQKAVKWLVNHQKPDGSWFGRWGICYLYGTWAALTGLASVGVKADFSIVNRALRWIESIQNSDGGWGESCKSDQTGRYVPLFASTPSQTAWALDALISFSPLPTPVIKSGISCLIRLLQESNWTHSYPTGAGWSGQFYMNYYSYGYIWPLLTLGHYRKKYKE